MHLLLRSPLPGTLSSSTSPLFFLSSSSTASHPVIPAVRFSWVGDSRTMLAALITTWHRLQWFEKRKHQLRKCHPKISLWIECGISSWSMIDVGGPLHPTGHGTTLCGWWVVLDDIRRQTEQTMRNKWVSWVPQWPLIKFLTKFLSLLPALALLNDLLLYSKLK